jgi:hypothetical protein
LGERTVGRPVSSPTGGGAPGPGFSGLRGGLTQIEILFWFRELSRICGKENFRLGRAMAAAPLSACDSRRAPDDLD